MAAPFFFGNNPVEVGRDARQFDFANRDNLNRRNDLTAQYAFGTRAIEDRNAQAMAQLAWQQQQQENELARESESIGERRFQFGQQLQQAKRAEDFQRFKFNADAKALDRDFKLRESVMIDKKSDQDTEVDNMGNSMAHALAQLRPASAAASAKFRDAETRFRQINDAALRDGFTFNERENKFTGTGPLLPNYNDRIGRALSELAAAQSMLEPVEKELNILDRQGRQLGFVIEPDGIRHARKGKFYPVEQATRTNQFTLPPSAGAPAAVSFPTGNPPALAPRFRRGTRVQQDGITYQFDGQNFAPIAR